MIGVNVKTQGIRSRLAAMRAEVERGMGAVALQAAKDTQHKARETTKFRNLSGQTRASIDVKPDGFRAVVRSEDPRVRWLNFGTGIYGPKGTPIVPTRAKFLRFVWNGQLMFRRSVRGIKATNFMRDALEYGRYWFSSHGRDMLRAAIQRFRA